MNTFILFNEFFIISSRKICLVYLHRKKDFIGVLFKNLAIDTENDFVGLSR